MNKVNALLLLCCVSCAPIFSAQKETTRARQDRETLQLINDGDRQAYEQKAERTE